MNKIILVAIMVLAFGLRGILLTKSPPSLYWEEVALGYDAYSILKTGKDYHGNPWLLVAFESFGDWKPSGYFYTLVPFLAILGLQDWVVRLPSVVAGTATVLLVYLMVRQISKREAWALWSALIIAITPWHIQFSRAAFEVNLATFFMTLGAYLILLARKKPIFLLLSTLSMAASMYTYHGLRVLAPLLAITLVLTNWSFFKKSKYLWVSLIFTLILVMPIIMAWFTPQIQQRIKETSLFSTSQAVAITNQERAEDGNTLLSRLIHHRYWYWGREILAGSISHFDPDFLFITGDTNPRHQTGFFALLYPWMIIPLLMGLNWILFKQGRGYRWMIWWILLATIPPALTNLTPHTLRFLPAAPALAMIIGLGMEGLCQRIRKQKLAGWLYSLMALIITGSVMVYIYDLWWVYPMRSSQEWQYGYKQVMQYLKPEYQKGTPIYFTRYYGRPSIYALFYLQVDPQHIQALEPNLPKDQGELLAFDNFYFDGRSPPPGSLIVSEKSDVPFQKIKTVNFLDGQTAFYIYEN